MHTAADTVDPILRTLCAPICVNCDYSLAGLPTDAACPECGTANSADILTIAGWAQRPRKSRSTKYWFLMSGYYALIAVALLISLRYSRDFLFQMTLQLGAGLIPVLVIQTRLFLSNVEGPPWRLRMSASGFEKRLGPGPLKLKPWQSDATTKVIARLGEMFELRVKSNGSFFRYRHSNLHILFYFDATSGQADALCRQTRAWMSQSSDGLASIRGFEVISPAARVDQIGAET